MKQTIRNEYFKYITLNICGMLGISCYILADTFFIANGIGADGLAALNLAIPIYSFVHGCGLMLGSGGATKFTIAKKQQEHQRADSIFTHCLFAALTAGLVFSAIGLLCSESITRLLKADTALFEMTDTYLKVILLFSPFFITNELLLAFVRNDGAPALSMTAMVSGSVANIILDYVFIYPFQMGIFGAVLATGIAPIVSMLILSRHLLKSSKGFHCRKCPLQLCTILDSAVLGFPALITEVSAGIVMILFNLLILGHSGNLGVAAYGIIANIALVATAIYTGIAQGSQPLISRAHSTGDNASIRLYHRLGIGSTVVISLWLYALLVLFADPITALFNSAHDPQLQEIARRGLVVYFTSMLFAGFNIVISTCFTATDTARPAHIISLLRGFFLIIPIALLFSMLWGLAGIWLSIPATELLTAALAAWLWHKRKS